MSEPVATPTQAPRSRPATRQTWIDRIARFPGSGLTTAQFCAAEGVSLPSFYAWKRRLANDPNGPSAEQPHEPPRLLPVRLQHPVPLDLVLPGGAALRLLPGCDLDLVRALLHRLGDTAC